MNELGRHLTIEGARRADRERLEARGWWNPGTLEIRVANSRITTAATNIDEKLRNCPNAHAYIIRPFNPERIA